MGTGIHSLRPLMVGSFKNPLHGFDKVHFIFCKIVTTDRIQGEKQSLLQVFKVAENLDNLKDQPR